jgi:GT2 family glycosyltransferase
MNEPFNALESPGGRASLTIPLGQGRNEQVSIIVVHHNRPDHLNICLQSIYSMSNLNNYECIVVDNASGQEAQDYLDVLQDEGVKVIRNEKNEFWSKAVNQGVHAADPASRYFVFMHDDTVVLDQSWLDVLINISHAESAGIVGTQLHHYYIKKQQVSFIQEWCMLMSRECFDDIGPWPEELPLVGMSFIMTLRAQLRGHKPQASGNNLVHHYKSFCMDPSEYERMAEKSMGMVGKLMAQTQRP